MMKEGVERQPNARFEKLSKKSHPIMWQSAKFFPITSGLRMTSEGMLYRCANFSNNGWVMMIWV